ncbi:MAG: hypothetical protein ACKOCX_11955, partial [Planctomycetota bacterium]
MNEAPGANGPSDRLWPALAWLVAIVATAVLVAAPWLDERLFAAGWLGIAAGLALAAGRRGWRSELAVLASAVIAITLAFHWT